MLRFVLLLCVFLPYGSARTLAPNQAAYAQRVARQAAVSAERAAVSAERLAGSAATSAKDALDTDNDGMVSTEELEGSIERLWSRCAGITRRASCFYAKYRDACLTTGGMLGLLHGGTVAYTILCARAFAATGWPMVRQSVAKMGDAYTAAMREMVGTKPVSPEEYAGMQAQLQEMAAEMEELVGDGASERRKEVLLCQMRALRAELDATAVHRALPVLLAAFEPTLVRDVVLGLWSGLTLSVAAASSAAARSLGIGVSIGEAIGASLTEASRRLEVAVRRWLRGVSPEVAALSTLGPRRLQRGAISLLSRTLGCWLAVRLQGLAALFSVSLLSAQALTEGMFGLLAASGLAPKRATAADGALVASHEAATRGAAQWVLAVAAVHVQSTRPRSPPLLLTVVLSPVLTLEALLRGVASQQEKAKLSPPNKKK